MIERLCLTFQQKQGVRWRPGCLSCHFSHSPITRSGAMWAAEKGLSCSGIFQCCPLRQRTLKHLTNLWVILFFFFLEGLQRLFYADAQMNPGPEHLAILHHLTLQESPFVPPAVHILLWLPISSGCPGAGGQKSLVGALPW